MRSEYRGVADKIEKITFSVLKLNANDYHLDKIIFKLKQAEIISGTDSLIVFALPDEITRKGDEE